jgi:hypothetical protein
MTALAPPAADEYGPAMAGYVGRIRHDETILPVLQTQLDEVVARLRTVPESRGGHRYAPGKWSVKEIVGHLSDAERIFAYRALRFARGDDSPLAPFDENAYVPAMEADGRTLADCTAEWADVRRATLALFRHLPEEAWARRGTASGKVTSVRALAYIIAGHVRHHLEVLGSRYGV